MSRSDSIAHLHQRLTQDLSPTWIQIQDDSHLHAGHQGQREHGGSHYSILLVSPLFEGKPLIERHRLVYATLATELQQSIHALALRTYAPSEWKASPPKPEPQNA